MGNCIQFREFSLWLNQTTESRFFWPEVLKVPVDNMKERLSFSLSDVKACRLECCRDGCPSNLHQPLHRMSTVLPEWPFSDDALLPLLHVVCMASIRRSSEHYLLKINALLTFKGTDPQICFYSQSSLWMVPLIVHGFIIAYLASDL